MNSIDDKENEIRKIINQCDVVEDAGHFVINFCLKHDEEKVDKMLNFLKENIKKREVTQSEIYEYALDLDDPSWRYTEVLIEDDDGKCYTQKEWKDKLKKENK